MRLFGRRLPRQTTLLSETCFIKSSDEMTPLNGSQKKVDTFIAGMIDKDAFKTSVRNEGK
jgi:hypothetical protein